MKKTIASVAGLVLLALPLSAAAQSTDVSSLLSQVQTLQAQLQQLLPQAPASQATPPQGSSTLQASIGSSVSSSASASCPQLSHNLSLGSTDATTGGDVSQLQQFLINTGDYTYSSITGYFGPATESALQEWQAKNGVVASGTADTTGYGALGPRTRAAIAGNCTGGMHQNGSNPSQPLTVTPSGGSAPLYVTFSARTVQSNATYTVDFGDGTNADMQSVCNDSYPPKCSASANHIYKGAGVYTATLASAGVILGEVTVPVAGTTATSFSASPASGQPPLTVTFAWGGANTSAVKVDFGDGTQGSCTDSCASGSMTHIYTSAGTYQANVTAGGMPLGTATIAVGATSTPGMVTPSSSALNVTPTSGAAPLAVNFSANNLKSDHVYSIDTGDGSVSTLQLMCSATYPYTCRTTLNHTYQNTGTYTAKLLSGMTLMGSATVSVFAVSPAGSFTTYPAAATLSYAPTSGAAPLTVTFSWTGGGTSAVGFDFGDGSRGACADSCATGHISHTYASPGTYSAKFSAGGATFGAAVIVVNGNTSAATSSYANLASVLTALSSALDGLRSSLGI